jgi:hypothetical protein
MFYTALRATGRVFSARVLQGSWVFVALQNVRYWHIPAVGQARACPQLAKADIRVECAPEAGQVEISDLTG